MCPNKRVGRDEHGVGLQVMSHVTPSLSNNAFVLKQVDRRGYQADSERGMEWGECTDRDWCIVW